MYGRCTSIRGSSRNCDCGITEKKSLFIYSYKLSKEILSITKSIKFARHHKTIQWHEVTNDVIYYVIIFERDSRHFTNVRKLTMTTGGLNWSSNE